MKVIRRFVPAALIAGLAAAAAFAGGVQFLRDVKPDQWYIKGQ